MVSLRGLINPSLVRKTKPGYPQTPRDTLGNRFIHLVRKTQEQGDHLDIPPLRPPATTIVRRALTKPAYPLTCIQRRRENRYVPCRFSNRLPIVACIFPLCYSYNLPSRAHRCNRHTTARIVPRRVQRIPRTVTALHPTQRMTRPRTPLSPSIFHHIALAHPLIPVNATGWYLHHRHPTINQRVRNIEKNTTTGTIRDITSSISVYEKMTFSNTSIYLLRGLKPATPIAGFFFSPPFSGSLFYRTVGQCQVICYKNTQLMPSGELRNK
jgi:hypothetical protein